MLLTRIRPKATLAGLGCLAMSLATASTARADNIDNALHKVVGQVMKDLQAHGYKNVGVLKFQVKRGNMPPTLSAGKLNYLMATRLENALVMVNRDSAPIGLTRGASAVAADKDKNATYLTAEGRLSLFNHKYPLAWGKEEVTVDAFLTGIVDIAPDMLKTTVVIKVFDPKDKKELKPRDIVSFTVDTDLAILRDTNQNFVVARRSFNSWANADDPDDELNKLAVKDIVVKETPSVKGAAPAKDLPRQFANALSDYLDFRIFYDGKAVDITPDGFLSKPAAGQPVLIKVTSKVKKLGLLLRINGVNTLGEQADEKSSLSEYSWWVLDEGVEYTIKGFYRDGLVKAFVAKASSDVDIATELGEKAERHGKIEFDVFVDPTTLAKGTSAKGRKKEDYSFRPVADRAASFEELKSQIRENMPVQKKTVLRNFIVGGAVENQKLSTISFDGRHVAGISIGYRGESDR